MRIDFDLMPDFNLVRYDRIGTCAYINICFDTNIDSNTVWIIVNWVFGIKP